MRKDRLATPNCSIFLDETAYACPDERTLSERLRAANGRAITSLLAAEGPMSRADLVRGTGLSRTTVSSLISGLIASGHVTETSDRGTPHKGGSGRPPLLVALSAPAGRGGRASTSATGTSGSRPRTARGTVLAEEVAAVDVDAHGVEALDQAARMTRAVAPPRRPLPRDLQAIGMCVPAPLDRRSARIRTGILPGWQDLNPADGDGAAARPCRCSRTTTPTSARWPSSTTAQPGVSPTSST